MREDELMNTYVLMSNFQSNSVPPFLYGVIDTQKRPKKNGELPGSPHSFPYYLKDEACPEQLLLLCENENQNLDFDYYKFGMGHIISDKFFDIIKNTNSSEYFFRKLIAIRAENDAIIRSDFNYVYFPNNQQFIDDAASTLVEDKFGNVVPQSLVLNSNITTYDIFTIHKTLLSGYLFLSPRAADLISGESLNGIKIVDLNNAFKHHCADYHYDIELSKKPTKKKLP
jgi:hypothetical protein